MLCAAREQVGQIEACKARGWRVSICCPTPEVTSMNGVTVRAQSSLEEARTADAVIVGSGMRTREVVADGDLMSRLSLDPTRQLIARTEGTEAAASADGQNRGMTPTDRCPSTAPAHERFAAGCRAITPIPDSFRCDGELFKVAFEYGMAYVTLADGTLVKLPRMIKPGGEDPEAPRLYADGRLSFVQEIEGGRAVRFARGRMAWVTCERVTG